ncbi:hypothetical protein FHR32_005408 [Streptosporangium album]|uniref:Uncharacterized protein n=1 Tax=Streptosporangium album TaxID=47479 RepID=A0A7W7RZE0_9ACTN|nr:hypothetical protein [Streptosporangium album]
MRFLGINAIFHDPAAPVTGVKAAAPEKRGRLSRREYGRRPFPLPACEVAVCPPAEPS